MSDPILGVCHYVRRTQTEEGAVRQHAETQTAATTMAAVGSVHVHVYTYMYIFMFTHIYTMYL